MSASVAVLGLGSMGSAIAQRLADSGEVTVWNRSSVALLERLPSTATIAGSVAEAARADVVITCLTADAAVREVILAEHGVAAAVRPGTVVVDCSTIGPDTAREVCAHLAERRVEFLDAPVSGGPEAARRGALSVLCGGTEIAFEMARPVLERFAGTLVHLGPPGSGQVAKAVNQIVLAGAFLGVAEGVLLAQRTGVDARRLIEALRDGAAASWVLSQRSSLMLDGDFAPRGRMALHHKDLMIAQQIAEAAGLSLPGLDLVTMLEARAIEHGHGDDDVAAIITALEGCE